MRATLDGFDLEVDSAVGWALQRGTGAHVRTLTLAEVTARAIFDQAQIDGSVLRMEALEPGEPGVVQEVKRLTVLGVGPSSVRGMATITIADQRWRWNRLHYKRSFNMRRRTGERRRLPGGDVPLAAQAIADDVAFAPWSINPTTGLRWTAPEVVREVFNTTLTELATDTTNNPPELVDLTGAAAVENVPVEGLDLDDTMDASIGRLLSYMGGRISCFVDWEGKVVVYDRTDGSESALFGVSNRLGGTRTAQDVAGLGEPVVNTPLFMRQDRRNERPRAVRVLFTTLPELRINAEEPSPSQAVRAPAEARMDNVMVSTEDLKLGDLGGNREVVQGTVLTHDVALEAFNNPENGARPLPSLPDLSVDLVRRRWLSPLLVAWCWQAVDQAGVWRRRVANIRGSYRLLYQVQQYWRDRIREYRDTLVSVYDSESGVRTKAAVYADHAIQQSVRWFDSKRTADDKAKHEIFRNVYANQDSGPGNVLNTPIGSLKQASANISIADQDLGLIQLSYDTDFTGEALVVYRSAFDPDKLPTDDTTQTRNGRGVHTGLGDFQQQHEVSVLLSAVPSSPNDKSALYAVEITPQDLGNEAFGRAIGEARGPVMEIRVPATTHVARFAWPNSRDGLKQSEQGAWLAFGEGSQAIEEGYGPPVNLNELQGIARAMATATYQGFLDRVEGQLTTALVPDTQLQGNLSGVQVEADGTPGGGLMLTIQSPPEGQPVDFMSLMPAGVRRAVFRLVDLKL